VAKAYIDQLERSQALPADRIASLRQAIQSAETAKLNRKSLASLTSLAASVEQSAGMANGADATRLHALADILQRPSR
jgi:hypothetical protein